MSLEFLILKSLCINCLVLTDFPKWSFILWLCCQRTLATREGLDYGVCVSMIVASSATNSWRTMILCRTLCHGIGRLCRTLQRRVLWMRLIIFHLLQRCIARIFRNQARDHRPHPFRILEQEYPHKDPSTCRAVKDTHRKRTMCFLGYPHKDPNLEKSFATSLLFRLYFFLFGCFLVFYGQE